MKKSHVYFLTNKNKTVIYIGVTSNLLKRIYQHKTKEYKGFTAKYNCDMLVYYEEFDDITQAIAREKQLKSGNRKRKEALINQHNPNWNDLSEGWLFNI
jgi:putative endonuclease